MMVPRLCAAAQAAVFTVFDREHHLIPKSLRLFGIMLSAG
jgi:hypothetical protein